MAMCTSEFRSHFVNFHSFPSPCILLCILVRCLQTVIVWFWFAFILYNRCYAISLFVCNRYFYSRFYIAWAFSAVIFVPDLRTCLFHFIVHQRTILYILRTESQDCAVATTVIQPQQKQWFSLLRPFCCLSAHLVFSSSLFLSIQSASIIFRRQELFR